MSHVIVRHERLTAGVGVCDSETVASVLGALGVGVGAQLRRAVHLRPRYCVNVGKRGSERVPLPFSFVRSSLALRLSFTTLACSCQSLCNHRQCTQFPENQCKC